jgi:hypothetical protein
VVKHPDDHVTGHLDTQFLGFLLFEGRVDMHLKFKTAIAYFS